MEMVKSSEHDMKDPTRRRQLIDRMNDLESKGMGCLGCIGTCCTFEANSMLITPLEAFELFKYLKENQLLNTELRSKLEQAIKLYRLEPKYSGERRSYLRKTYTCPFFNHQELGCPLPREIKPYGCLGFNSHHPELKADENCYSETALLEERENAHPEEGKMNEEIIIQWGLLWEKSPIPNALIEFWTKSEKQ
jgi:hypothetical protein